MWDLIPPRRLFKEIPASDNDEDIDTDLARTTLLQNMLILEFPRAVSPVIPKPMDHIAVIIIFPHNSHFFACFVRLFGSIPPRFATVRSRGTIDRIYR
jgi:hypothetical protein